MTDTKIVLDTLRGIANGIGDNNKEAVLSDAECLFVDPIADIAV